MAVREIQNREEIIFAAINMKSLGAGTPEIIERIKNEFDETVSRSFITNNLRIYEECRTLTEVKELAEKRINQGKKAASGNSKKKNGSKWDDNVKQLGSCVFEHILDNLDDIMSESELKLPVQDQEFVDISFISDIHAKTRNYVTAQLVNLVLPTPSKPTPEPKPEPEANPVKETPLKPEPAKVEDNHRPDLVGKPGGKPYEQQEGWKREAKPGDQSPQFSDGQQELSELETSILRDYNDGIDPQEIADAHNMKLEDVLELLGITKKLSKSSTKKTKTMIKTK